MKFDLGNPKKNQTKRKREKGEFCLKILWEKIKTELGEYYQEKVDLKSCQFEGNKLIGIQNVAKLDEAIEKSFGEFAEDTDENQTAVFFSLFSLEFLHGK